VHSQQRWLAGLLQKAAYVVLLLMQAILHSNQMKQEFLVCADLQKLSTDKEDIRDLYIDYLSQYRECLAETEIDKLDGKWCILDEKWMKIRYPVQVGQSLLGLSLALRLHLSLCLSLSLG